MGNQFSAINMKMIRAALVAGPLAISMSATRSAQPPAVIGLVNVQIVDVIDDIDDINVNLGVAVQIAANVCAVAVGAIAREVQDGIATCDRVLSGLLSDA